MSEEEQYQQEIAYLLRDLEYTDWYAIRESENGTPIPQDISNMREAARSRISELRNKLMQLNQPKES